MTEPFADAIASGALANADAVLHVRQSTTDAGMRAIDIVPFGGIAVRILPDRGLDIGPAWFRGVPLAWVSRIGESPPVSHLEGMAWGEGFGGGLMVTCGLRNVGMPSEGHGLHGTFSHLPATDVAIERLPDGEVVVITGTVVDDDDPRLVVRRRITVAAGSGRVVLEDETTNEGDEPAPAPLLYHCNFGFPLWSDGAHLDLAPVTTSARDDDSTDVLGRWGRPLPVAKGPERVLEHRLDSAEAWATVSNANLGMAVTIRWDGDTLPWINQWLDPNPGMAVLGIEPASCRTRGRAFERTHGSLPMLEPASVRRTSLTFEAAAIE